MLEKVGALILLTAASTCWTKYPSCYIGGVLWESQLAVNDVPDPFSCQGICSESLSANSEKCKFFSWSNFTLICFLLPIVDETTPTYPCADCVSGPSSCSCSNPVTCTHQNDIIDNIPSVPSEVTCQNICFNTPDCQFYSWFRENDHPFESKECLLFTQCEDTVDSTACVSGPPDCHEEKTTSTVRTPTTTTEIQTTSQDMTTTEIPTTSARTTTKVTTTTASTTTTSTIITTTITTTTTTTTTTITTATTSTSTTTTKLTSTTTFTTSTSVTTVTTTPKITTTSMKSCIDLPTPNMGAWFCSGLIQSQICHLECEPGYVSSRRTMTTCTSGLWSTDPKEMECVPAVALIAGGYHKHEKDVEVYGNDFHIYLHDLPDKRDFHTLNYVDSHLLLCGGMESHTKTSCLQMNEDHNTWVQHSSTQHTRYKHTGIELLGQLHLLGGEASSYTTEYIMPSSSNQWQNGPSLEFSIEQSCIIKISPEEFMVTGGYQDNHLAISINITSGEVTNLDRLHHGRYNHGCALIRHENTKGVLITGGETHGYVRKTTEFYDLETKKWESMGPLHEERSGPGIIMLKDTVYAFGGKDHRNDPMKSVEMFSLEHRSWERADYMMETRIDYAVAAVPEYWFTTTTTTDMETSTTPDNPTSCSDLPTLNMAFWFCSGLKESQTCHLECEPGYVSSGRTMTNCISGSWSTDPEDMRCVPAVAMVAGGYHHHEKDVEVYGEGFHKYLHDLPNKRNFHTLNFVDSHILLCGGKEGHSKTSCLQLNEDHNTWDEHSSMNYDRYKHNGVVLLSQLHILGGEASPDTTEVMIPSRDTQWHQGDPLKMNTEQSCIVKISPEEYMITGGTQDGHSVISINITSGTSTTLTRLHHSRFNHGCALIRHENSKGVLVTGGETHGYVRKTTEFYNLQTKHWESMGSLNQARSIPAIIMLKDRVYAFGGKDERGDPLESVEMFSLEHKSWEWADYMMETRIDYAIEAVPEEWFH